MATLAQNGDGLRADQAGAADDEDHLQVTLLVEAANSAPRVLSQTRPRTNRAHRVIRAASCTNCRADADLGTSPQIVADSVKERMA
jgi:hypothetical protein